MISINYTLGTMTTDTFQRWIYCRRRQDSTWLSFCHV